MSHPQFDHLHVSRSRWWLVIAGGLITLVCGTVGFMQLAPHGAGHDQGAAMRLSGAFYAAVQMFVLHTPHLEETNAWVETGRWCGALTLVTGTTFLLWRRLRHEWLEFGRRFWRGHCVVCGLGERGFAEARRLARETRVVVLDPAPDPGLMLECEARGILVHRHDAARPEVLDRAGVRHCREVVIVTDRDETNVGIAIALKRLESARGPFAGRCRVHLSDINLREALQQAAGSLVTGGGMAFEFFDLFRSEAERILQVLDGDGRALAAGRHLVILGFGRMGRSIVLRAAEVDLAGRTRPLRVTVVDRVGTRQRERFLFRHPELEPVIEFVDAEAESLTTRRLLERLVAGRDGALQVFICVDENARAAEIALRIRDILRSCPGCALAVRVKSREPLGDVLKPGEAGGGTTGPRVEVFGMVEGHSRE